MKVFRLAAMAQALAAQTQMRLEEIKTDSNDRQPKHKYIVETISSKKWKGNKSQDRNALCNCKSGKKAKKCCL